MTRLLLRTVTAGPLIAAFLSALLAYSTHAEPMAGGLGHNAPRSAPLASHVVPTASTLWSASRIPGPTVPDGLGVDIHWTNPRAGEMRMLAATGLRWIRMDLTWSATEVKKGQYTFAPYNRLISALRRYRIRPLLILCYGNPLYQHGAFPTTPAAREAFAKWAAAAVRTFRGYGVMWELWNEPNGGNNPTLPPAFAKLAMEVGQSIHKADSHALFVGPALASFGGFGWNPSLKYANILWLEKIFKKGVLTEFSAITVHPYRYSPPETVASNGLAVHARSAKNYAAVRALIRSYSPAGKRIPVLSGEWGYSVVSYFSGGKPAGAVSSRHPNLQGKYLAREFLVNLMCHIPLSIWYDWHNDGASPTDGECHFGMVRFRYHRHRHWVYTPKPAFFACRTLTRTLDGFHFEKRIRESNPNNFVLVFAHGVQRCWVAWCVVKPKPGRGVITLPVPPGRYRVTNYLGAEHVTGRAGVGGLKLQLSTGPQYIIPSATE